MTALGMDHLELPAGRGTEVGVQVPGRAVLNRLAEADLLDHLPRMVPSGDGLGDGTGRCSGLVRYQVGGIETLYSQ